MSACSTRRLFRSRMSSFCNLIASRANDILLHDFSCSIYILVKYFLFNFCTFLNGQHHRMLQIHFSHSIQLKFPHLFESLNLKFKVLIGNLTARMIIHILSYINDLIFDNNPAVFSTIMLSYFFSGKKSGHF